MIIYQKKEIVELVNDNYSIILDDINENDFADTNNIAVVKEVYHDSDVIDVYCGGTVIGSATSYYGFYYSPDDLPKDAWCGSSFGQTSDELKPEGKGFAIKYSNEIIAIIRRRLEIIFITTRHIFNWHLNCALII